MRERSAARIRPARVYASGRWLARFLLGVAALIVVAACATGAGDDGGPAVPTADTTGEMTVENGVALLDLDYGDRVAAVWAALIVEWYADGEPVGVPPIRITPLPESGRARLPLAGLEDGRTYEALLTVEFRDGTRGVLPERPTVTVNVGLPQPVAAGELRATLSPRPAIRWEFAPGDLENLSQIAVAVEFADGAVDTGVTVETVGTDRALIVVTPREDLVNGDAMAAGASRSVRVRLVSPDGILGRWSEERLLIWDLAVLRPEATTGGDGQPSIVARPALSWTPVDGAIGYDVELGPGPQGEMTLRSVEQPRISLTADIVDLVATLDTLTPVVTWRVRARGEGGVVTPWSESFSLVWSPSVPRFVTVLPPGARAQVTLGDTRRPALAGPTTVTVELNRPYALARSPLTVGLAVDLFNVLLLRGEAVIDGEVVRDRDGRVLLGLGALDLGRQWAMDVEAGEADAGPGDANPPPASPLAASPETASRLAVRAGYAAHPVVGITWYGAVRLANELSRREGLEAVYRIAAGGEGDADGTDVTIVRDASGYRLPTETEWALALALARPISAGVASGASAAAGAADAAAAAGAETTGAAQPIPLTVATEARDIGPAELRGINYQRSGDRWESTAAPYSQAGGPTTPVGALGFTWPLGLLDLLGQVWEWTDDWYVDDGYRVIADGTVDPYGPESATPDIYGRTLRVVRGSAWSTPRDALIPAARGSYAPGATSYAIGVRFARTLR